MYLSVFVSGMHSYTRPRRSRALLASSSHGGTFLCNTCVCTAELLRVCLPSWSSLFVRVVPSEFYCRTCLSLVMSRGFLFINFFVSSFSFASRLFYWFAALMASASCLTSASMRSSRRLSSINFFTIARSTAACSTRSSICRISTCSSGLA